MQQAILEALEHEAGRIADLLRREGQDVLSNNQTWQDYQQHLLDALTPLLQGITQQGIDAARAALGRGVPDTVNWSLVNRNAAEWAKQYAGELISGVTDTTKRQVGGIVGDWIQAKETLPDLIARITDLKNPGGGSLFGPVRAEMIAVTEATNVYAEANAQAWQALGVQPAAFKPAAHVRCRCSLKPKQLPNGVWVMMWSTARDEDVCVQDIKVPWGNVEGCKDLQSRIVSEGDYLGLKLDEAVRRASQ